MRRRAYTSKVDMVTAALRERIITGVLMPGTWLRQRDLAEQLGVSPTPVREALRRLEAEGLVKDEPYRGCTVVNRGFGASRENYEIRALLEPMAARLAADRITDEQLAEIRAIHEELASCEFDDPSVNRLNRELHLRIASAAGSPLILSLVSLLWQAFPYGPQMIRPHAESVAQHGELLQALTARDAEAAAEIAHAHIAGVMAWLEEQREGQAASGVTGG